MEIPEQFCAAFHESSNRAHLILGCETKLIVLDGLGFLVTAWSFMPNLWGVVFSGAVFFFVWQMLRLMAKQDPIYSAVYKEAQRYGQGFWPARPQRGEKPSTLKRILLGAVTLGFKG